MINEDEKWRAERIEDHWSEHCGWAVIREWPEPNRPELERMLAMNLTKDIAHVIASAPDMLISNRQAYTALDGVNTAEASAARIALDASFFKATGAP